MTSTEPRARSCESVLDQSMSFRMVRLLCALILGILPTRAIAAQRVLTTFDVGATHMQYADSLDVNAMSFSPALSADWDRVRLRGTGTFAKLATEGWSTQGVLSGSLFSAQ